MNEVRHVPVVDHICIGNTPFVYTILSSCRLLVQFPYIVYYLLVITELKGIILADFCLYMFCFLVGNYIMPAVWPACMLVKFRWRLPRYITMDLYVLCICWQWCHNMARSLLFCAEWDVYFAFLRFFASTSCYHWTKYYDDTYSDQKTFGLPTICLSM